MRAARACAPDRESYRSGRPPGLPVSVSQTMNGRAAASGDRRFWRAVACTFRTSSRPRTGTAPASGSAAVVRPGSASTRRPSTDRRGRTGEEVSPPSPSGRPRRSPCAGRRRASAWPARRAPIPSRSRSLLAVLAVVLLAPAGAAKELAVLLATLSSGRLARASGRVLADLVLSVVLGVPRIVLVAAVLVTGDLAHAHSISASQRTHTPKCTLCSGRQTPSPSMHSSGPTSSRRPQSLQTRSVLSVTMISSLCCPILQKSGGPSSISSPSVAKKSPLLMVSSLVVVPRYHATPHRASSGGQRVSERADFLAEDPAERHLGLHVRAVVAALVNDIHHERLRLRGAVPVLHHAQDLGRLALVVVAGARVELPALQRLDRLHVREDLGGRDLRRDVADVAIRQLHDPPAVGREADEDERPVVDRVPELLAGLRLVERHGQPLRSISSSASSAMRT